jgi:hypothetical protein
MEIVKCKNFEKEIVRAGENEKGPFPALTYAACFSLNFFIWIIIDSRAISNEDSKDLEVCLTKSSCPGNFTLISAILSLI